MDRIKTFISMLLLASGCKDVPVHTAESNMMDSIISVKNIDSIILGSQKYSLPDSEKKNFIVLRDSIKNSVFNGKNLKNKKRDSLIFEALEAYHDYCGEVRYSLNYLPRLKGVSYDTNWYVCTNQYVGGDDSLQSFFSSHIRSEIKIPLSYFDSTGEYNLTLNFKVGRGKKIYELGISTNTYKEYTPFTQEMSRLCFMLPCWNRKTCYIDNNYKNSKKELIEMQYWYLVSINKEGKIKLRLIDKEKCD